MTPSVLALAAAIFGIIKALFSFLSWLLQPEEPLLRRHLDAIRSKLHSVSLHDAALEVLGTIHSRIEAHFALHSYKSFWWASFAANYIFAIVGNSVLGFIVNTGFWQAFRDLNFAAYLGLGLLAGVLAILDVLSLQITTKLLGHIAGRSRFVVVFLHILGQVVVIGVIFFVAMAYFQFLMEPSHYRVGKWPGSSIWGVLSRIPELLVMFPSRTPMYFVIIGSLTFMGALPTVMYTLALLALIIIWPTWSWKFTRRIVFLITTEKTPVLGQLGNFIGGLAGVMTIVVDFFKK